MTTATLRLFLIDLLDFASQQGPIVAVQVATMRNRAIGSADMLALFLQSKGWNIQQTSPLTSQESALPPQYNVEAIITNIKALIANIEADVKAPSVETTVSIIENVAAVLKNGASLWATLVGMHASAKPMPLDMAVTKCKEFCAAHEAASHEAGMKALAIDPILVEALFTVVKSILSKYFGI